MELRADEEVEAALRVSCFSFGPRGLKVMEAEPIPVVTPAKDEDGKTQERSRQFKIMSTNYFFLKMMTISLGLEVMMMMTMTS